MKYYKFKEKQQKEMNEFPMVFAFSKGRLFEQIKEKWEIEEKNAFKELTSIGGGGFIRRKDKSKFLEMLSRHDKELEEFLSSDDNLLDAMKHELNNHEYCYTGDPEPALDVLGLSYPKMTSREKKIFNMAVRRT